MVLRFVKMIPIVFLILAFVFFVFGIRSGSNSITRRVRTRIALIFLVVGMGLLVLQAISPSP